MTQSVYVEGLRETQRALAKLGVSVEELKDVMADVAREAAQVTAGFVPVKSGALKNTVRGNRAKGRATVTVGRSKTSKYAGVQNYGWPAKNIPATNFVQKTDEAFGDRAVHMVDDGIQRLIRDHGLA